VPHTRRELVVTTTLARRRACAPPATSGQLQAEEEHAAQAMSLTQIRLAFAAWMAKVRALADAELR